VTDGPVRLRTVTLNVWNDDRHPGRVRLINDELRRLDPDLVSLQEVVHTDGRQQLDELLAGTGLYRTHQHEVIGHARSSADGIAVATRWPHGVLDVDDHALAVATTIPGVGDQLFIGVAASYELDDEAARERQALAVTDVDRRHRRELPTIIAGDFNGVPHSAAIRYLTGLQSLHGRSAHFHDAWTVAGEGPGDTWTAENPNARSEIERIIRQPNHRRRIDYVFVGSWHVHPNARAEIVDASLAFDRPVDGLWPSDHYGVVVELDVRADRGQD
jgi:endonuclease/exonuclease/phosphatase family metal-dependent hydrolase